MSDFGTQTGRKTLSLRCFVLFVASKRFVQGEVQHLQTRYDQRCLDVEENGNVLRGRKWHPLPILNDLRDELRRC